jgi:hypothetical protein
MLLVAGALAGVLWYLGMRWIMPIVFKLMDGAPRR